VLRKSQETRGPEWVLNSRQIILDEWFSKYYAEVELPALPDWKEVEGRPEIRRLIAEKPQRAPRDNTEQLIHCITTSINLHAPGALFAKKEIFNRRCLRHCLYAALSSTVPEAPINYALFKDYDRRRGQHLTHEAAVALKKSENRLLFEPLAPDVIKNIKSTLRTSRFDGSFHDVYQAQLDALISSKSIQALIGEADARPLVASVGSMLGVLSPSADLVAQYRADGTLSAHSDAERVALVPRYFQKRESPLALCLGIMLIAVLCQTSVACVSARLLHQLEDLLEALYPLERAYRRKSPEGLSVEPKELAEECQRLVTLHPTSASVPGLTSMLSTSSKSEPSGNVAAVSKGYSKSPSRLRRESGGHNEEGEEDDDDAAVSRILRQVADGLQDGHQEVMSLLTSPDAGLFL
jgi:hypothetical protein